MNRRILHGSILVVALGAMLAYAGMLPFAQAGTAPHLSLRPPAGDITAGDTFEIEVYGERMPSIGAFEAVVAFDDTKVAYISGLETAFLGSTGRTVECPPPAVVLEGIARFGCGSFYMPPPAPDGPSGDAVVARLTFRALAPGDTSLIFAGGGLAEELGDSIPVTFSGTNINIVLAAPPTAAPTATATSVPESSSTPTASLPVSALNIHCLLLAPYVDGDPDDSLDPLIDVTTACVSPLQPSTLLLIAQQIGDEDGSLEPADLSELDALDENQLQETCVTGFACANLIVAFMPREGPMAIQGTSALVVLESGTDDFFCQTEDQDADCSDATSGNGDGVVVVRLVNSTGERGHAESVFVHHRNVGLNVDVDVVGAPAASYLALSKSAIQNNSSAGRDECAAKSGIAHETSTASASLARIVALDQDGRQLTMIATTGLIHSLDPDFAAPGDAHPHLQLVGGLALTAAPPEGTLGGPAFYQVLCSGPHGGAVPLDAGVDANSDLDPYDLVVSGLLTILAPPSPTPGDPTSTPTPTLTASNTPTFTFTPTQTYTPTPSPTATLTTPPAVTRTVIASTRTVAPASATPETTGTVEPSESATPAAETETPGPRDTETPEPPATGTPAPKATETPNPEPTPGTPVFAPPGETVTAPASTSTSVPTATNTSTASTPTRTSSPAAGTTQSPEQTPPATAAGGEIAPESTVLGQTAAPTGIVLPATGEGLATRHPSWWIIAATIAVAGTSTLVAGLTQRRRRT